MGLCTHLKSFGIEVVGPFSNGEAALLGVAQQRPDLALLDIRMPGIDGLDVAKKLWEGHLVPTIIVSAYSTDQYVDRAQRTGVFGYLLKPITAENLRVSLRVAWSRAQAECEQVKRVEQLELTIAQRRTIEQAKWKLVQIEGVSEAEAHAILQRRARNERRRLMDVAHEILNGPSSAAPGTEST